MSTRIIQYLEPDQSPAVALVRNAMQVQKLAGFSGVRELALQTIDTGACLSEQIRQLATGPVLDYQALLDAKRVLPPILHPDPAHLLITGTGLTHLGSADTRAAMHAKLQGNIEMLSDSMRMFRLGVEGGKPETGQAGVQPEWFYKGDGSMLVAPEQDLSVPAFALDGGEEPEICGVYVISNDGVPWRIGHAMGNEFSDHVMEQINYLYLAHSKLRQCAIGPELLIGALPAHIEGRVRIVRNNSTLWEKPFLSGEDNMCHNHANLEAHHFKYRQFLRPGDVHVHFFGTGTLSYADKIRIEQGDRIEISSELFGRPLCNTVSRADDRSVQLRACE